MHSTVSIGSCCGIYCVPMASLKDISQCWRHCTRDWVAVSKQPLVQHHFPYHIWSMTRLNPITVSLSNYCWLCYERFHVFTWILYWVEWWMFHRSWLLDFTDDITLVAPDIQNHEMHVRKAVRMHGKKYWELMLGKPEHWVLVKQAYRYPHQHWASQRGELLPVPRQLDDTCWQCRRRPSSMTQKGINWSGLLIHWVCTPNYATTYL